MYKSFRDSKFLNKSKESEKDLLSSPEQNFAIYKTKIWV